MFGIDSSYLHFSYTKFGYPVQNSLPLYSYHIAASLQLIHCKIHCSWFIPRQLLGTVVQICPGHNYLQQLYNEPWQPPLIGHNVQPATNGKMSVAFWVWRLNVVTRLNTTEPRLGQIRSWTARVQAPTGVLRAGAVIPTATSPWEKSCDKPLGCHHQSPAPFLPGRNRDGHGDDSVTTLHSVIGCPKGCQWSSGVRRPLGNPAQHLSIQAKFTVSHPERFCSRSLRN